MALSHWKQTDFCPDGAVDELVVLGLGSDLCAVTRLDRELARETSDLLETVYLPAEAAWCRQHPHPAQAFAAHFAAKEAVIKALAAASGQGMFWRDIEIGVHGRDRPVVTLCGRLAELALGLGVRTIHLSWAQTGDYATACAIVSGSASVAQPDPTA